jgi:prepilin-type N-terminal cleavage/methylation domain-containing protein
MKLLITKGNRQNGFTVIELLIVIALVVIIAGMSVSFYSRFLTQNAVANTVDQLVGELRKAQLYSMMGRQNGTWGVAYNSNKITLFQGNTFATRNTAFDELFNINTNISITGFSELTFTKATGTPSASPTIVVAGNNNSKTITVNSLGVVSR